ncbi:dTDP-4-dehydrorhamnose 3,5-epimerase [Spirochaetia bacterium]|nr:dTDP-4-dehydrorhamnose 3,5-epimerase [Spirochaetia bacterium]
MFIFSKTNIDELVLISPHQFDDENGCFFKYFEKDVYREHGIAADFSEFSVNITHKRGTLKGMPYQRNPSQARLVYLIAGAIFDVALDLRKDSATFGKYECFYLSKENNKAIYMPENFAHGILILEDNTVICESFTGKYIPENCGRIIWNDKDLNIPWPIDTLGMAPIVSEKDSKAETFVQFLANRNV